MGYDEVMVMPSSYVVINEEEMTYIEGGVSLKIKKSYLNKSTCKSVAKKYTKKTGLSQTRIAKEIFAHAFLYYASPYVIGAYATALTMYSGLAVGV